ncbi:MAG: hypothetical protein G8D28_07625 [gamma proteobacterium symbiont of Phacoides pectinatus]
MAEINQPSPIKPVWLTRREERRPGWRGEEEKKRRDEDPSREPKSEPRPPPGDDGAPHVDEYV